MTEEQEKFWKILKDYPTQKGCDSCKWERGRLCSRPVVGSVDCYEGYSAWVWKHAY